MAMVGCREVGIIGPSQSRALVVWAEIDRCATDAIQSVTGCKLGKRTLKYVDYGKMAATFLNRGTGKAVRVVARDDSRERAGSYVPPDTPKKEAQLQAYSVMPEEELFVIQPVAIEVAPEDQPGHPLSRTACQRCGEGINDCREVLLNDRVLCRACAYGSYYTLLDGSSGNLVALERPATGANDHVQPTVPTFPRWQRRGDRPSIAALVLAGGEGLRMGAPKPFVLWRGIPLIEHVLERLRPIFSTICIVARDVEPFAYLGIPVIQDAGPERGPLMGLYSGLVGSDADWCFAVGCDMPFLSAAAIQYMSTFLDDGDIVAARAKGRVQLLHAFYSRRCVAEAAHLLRLGTTSLKPLLGRCRVTLLPEHELARVDHDLGSFTDVDTAEELARLNAVATP
jgi:formylmethanofuran dehydrogenase subunit E